MTRRPTPERQSRSSRRRPRRRGGMLLELVGSAALLGAVLVTIARVSVATDAQGRLARQRGLASQTLQNAMEEMAVVGPAERLARADAPLRIDEASALRLADAELTAAVAPVSDPEGQRVTLRLRWTHAPAAPRASLALTTYFYPPPEPQG